MLVADDAAEALLRRFGDLRVLTGQHRVALSPDGRRVPYAVRQAHGDAEARASRVSHPPPREEVPPGHRSSTRLSRGSRSDDGPSCRLVDAAHFGRPLPALPPRSRCSESRRVAAPPHRRAAGRRAPPLTRRPLALLLHPRAAGGGGPTGALRAVRDGGRRARAPAGGVGAARVEPVAPPAGGAPPRIDPRLLARRSALRPPAGRGPGPAGRRTAGGGG